MSAEPIGVNAAMTSPQAAAAAAANQAANVDPPSNSFDRVWFCRGIDIAQHWRSKFPIENGDKQI
jgi:hypothetical protein